MLAANTLTPIPALVPRVPADLDRVVKKIMISVNLTSVLVIGTSSLTIGSPGVAECYRFGYSAGSGGEMADFGEGLELGWFGDEGPWQMYSTTGPNTVDLTIILG